MAAEVVDATAGAVTYWVSAFGRSGAFIMTVKKISMLSRESQFPLFTPGQVMLPARGLPFNSASENAQAHLIG